MSDRVSSPRNYYFLRDSNYWKIWCLINFSLSLLSGGSSFVLTDLNSDENQQKSFPLNLWV